MKSHLPQDQAAVSSRPRDVLGMLESAYPTCRGLMKSDTWKRLLEICAEEQRPDSLSDKIALQRSGFGLPGYLAELARLEWALHEAATASPAFPLDVDQLTVNPTLHVLELSWKYLPELLNSPPGKARKPEPGHTIALVWQHPRTHETDVRTASDEDILVIKMAVEAIEVEEVARLGRLPTAAVQGAIHRALTKGFLIGPSSRIRRDLDGFAMPDKTMEAFLSAPVFTLQWHITQACDLHCKHCYDRTDRSPVGLEEGLKVLDDLSGFCRERHVKGQVSFTGGNPLLHPRFFDLYGSAADRGLMVAILGNPAPERQLEKMLRIKRPVFYQVSLEGLQPHNDDIRGPGHFERTLQFLELLRAVEIPSKVMLTLTEGNVDQVLSLAERLRDLTDDFTFNRLSMVGEGANLRLPSRDDFIAFLQAYVNASTRNPTMGWKDNFINLISRREGIPPFGGCTGFGCGAAFNFVSLLSDGQIHACRKFPSPIGNIFEQGLAEIYDSDIAHRYRRGPESCRDCSLWPVCRGCLAVSHSHGLNVFQDRDPLCFITLQDPTPSGSA